MYFIKLSHYKSTDRVFGTILKSVTCNLILTRTVGDSSKLRETGGYRYHG